MSKSKSRVAPSDPVPPGLAKAEAYAERTLSIVRTQLRNFELSRAAEEFANFRGVMWALMEGRIITEDQVSVMIAKITGITEKL